MHNGKQKWYEHMERKVMKSWVKRNICMNIAGRITSDIPRWTWDTVLQNDLSRNAAFDRIAE